MEVSVVKERLMAVLVEIQEQSGLECPTLTGSTRPVESLPKFNSKIWAVAINLLSDKLAASIPNEANIFMNRNTKQLYSIDESAELVCQILAKQDLAKTEAA